jgi:hypothetical protein
MVALPRALVLISSFAFLGCGGGIERQEPTATAGQESGLKLPCTGRLDAFVSQTPTAKKAPSTFPSIGAALAEAAKLLTCEVWVTAEAGDYKEGTLAITRSTHIVGQARSLVNISGRFDVTSGNDLELSKLSIADAAAPGAVVASGGALVTLDGVTIQRARGNAVAMYGGRLTATNMLVEQTFASSSDLSSGAGFLLTAGAKGSLDGVWAVKNVHGLIVDGVGTHGSVGAMLIVQSTAHPDLDVDHSEAWPAYGFGAVEVRAHGELDADDLRLSANALLGLDVIGAGSVARIATLTVSRTASVPATPPASVGGFGVRVAYGGGITLGRFDIAQNEAAGFWFQNAFAADVTLGRGIVRGNNVAIFATGASDGAIADKIHVAWLAHEIQLVDNDILVDFGAPIGLPPLEL